MMSTGEKTASTKKTEVRTTRPIVVAARPGRTHDRAHLGRPAPPKNSAPTAALNDTKPKKATIGMTRRGKSTPHIDGRPHLGAPPDPSIRDGGLDLFRCSA